MADRPALTNPRDSGDYLRARLRHLPYEVFGCLYLDNRNRVLAFEELFRGTVDGASVHPREVVSLVLEKRAAAVVMVHNHPSGVAESSRADEQITKLIQQCLALIQVRVIDHLIVAGSEVMSMAEQGRL